MVQVQTLMQGYSFATSEGGVGYCSVTVLRGEKLTLVDVGHVGRRGMMLERLAAAGIRPEEVERVILTHAHWDHSLNVDCFPNAEVLLHIDELNYTAAPSPLDWATPVWIADILGRARTSGVRDGDEIEPGVRIMATPGHSPGSLSVLVESGEGVIGLVGDALPNRAAAGYMAPRLVFWDLDEAKASAQKIVDSCRFIYPGHDRPFRVESGSFYYMEPTSVQLLYPPTDEEGRVLASINAEPAPPGPIIVASARQAQLAAADDD